jgi:hypothetical protein
MLNQLFSFCQQTNSRVTLVVFDWGLKISSPVNDKNFSSQLIISYICIYIYPSADAVRDIELTPLKETYEVGEEIRCSASGHPRPSVIIRPATGSGKTGAGSASVFVPESWLGPQPIGLSCTASNTAFGKESSVTKNITFSVVASGIYLFHLKNKRMIITTRESADLSTKTSTCRSAFDYFYYFCNQVSLAV